jgi:pimeloyl-ACP methyl ester carboxylesterase
MDASSYKDITTSRALLYHYFYSAPRDAKPTLLFLHGFPSTSYDWRQQVVFFRQEGYGLIVPDLLGYGGTAKPTDAAAYKQSLICADLVDILDAEKVSQAIVIGHDWGSVTTGRLANYYPDRFTGFAFLAVGYVAPNPHFNVDAINAMTKQMVGYELMGYWIFFSEEEAHKLIETHWDSFYSIVFAKDETLWRTNFGPTGTLKAWLAADKTTPVGSFLTQEDADIQKDLLLNGGFAAPLCWYKCVTSGLSSEDDATIPMEQYSIAKPTFFGGAKNDTIGLVALQMPAFAQFAKNTTIRQFDAGHWVALQAAEEVNKELLAWIQSV